MDAWLHSIGNHKKSEWTKYISIHKIIAFDKIFATSNFANKAKKKDWKIAAEKLVGGVWEFIPILNKINNGEMGD